MISQGSEGEGRGASFMPKGDPKTGVETAGNFDSWGIYRDGASALSMLSDITEIMPARWNAQDLSAMTNCILLWDSFVSQGGMWVQEGWKLVHAELKSAASDLPVG